jgi:DNA-binding GntR family transcriptional regulator
MPVLEFLDDIKILSNMQAESEPPRANKESLGAQAYRRIRLALRQGAFSPGQKLILRTVAAQLQVSPTPLRDAFSRLVSESALVVDAKGIVSVPDITAAQYREIRNFRLDIEGRAGMIATRCATPADIEKLQAIDKIFVTAMKEGRSHAALDANEKFHFGLYSLADMPVLYSVIDGLWLRCGPLFIRLRDKIYPSSARSPHETILEGLRQGDPELVSHGIATDIMKGWAKLRNYDETLQRLCDVQPDRPIRRKSRARAK